MIPRGIAVLALAFAIGPLASQSGAQTTEETPSTAPTPVAERESPAVRGQIEQITVTARKREESLEDTPVSVVAFGADDLEARSTEDLTGLGQAVANLDLSASNSNTRNNAIIFIRGIGQDDIALTNDLGVGAYIDGVYQARMQGSITRIADIERIEVLRGPQGTLFGRNTTGGAVDIITAKPKEDFAARLKLTAGNHRRFESQGMLNYPLTESLFARFNIATATTDGYSKDSFQDARRDDTKYIGFRGSLRYLPTEASDVTLTYDYSKAHQENRLGECVITNLAGLALFVPGYRAACQRNSDNDEFRAAYDTPSKDYVDTWSATLEYNLDLTDNLQLTSLSSVRRMEWERNNETDQTEINTIQNFEDAEQDAFSSELQLTGNAADGRLQYVTGLYWYREKASQFSPSVIHGFELAIPQFPSMVATQRTSRALSYAAFGQLTYNVTDRLSLTGGLRRSHDKKQFRTFSLTTPDTFNLGCLTNPALFRTPECVNRTDLVRSDSLGGDTDRHPKERFDSWTPMANASFHVTEDLMTYVTWSKGFRSGGFNGRPSVNDPDLNLQSFDEEKVSAWEAGAKGTFFNRRLQVNLALFYMDYEDMQLTNFRTEINRQTGTPTFVSVVENVGDSTIKGLELEATAVPTPDLTLTLGFGITDAEFDSFDADLNSDGIVTDNSDLDLRRAPTYTANVGAAYEFDVGNLGTLTARADYAFRSRSIIDVINTPELEQGKYGLLNARLTLALPDGKTEIAAWGRNLTDRRYLVGGVENGQLFGTISRYYGAPTMYGVDVVRRF